eukprot:Sspe_Gene.14455::Locus_5005_Transcript_1_1_Confidence_1.000_Length_1711::g.14455::m.14455/K14415/RTCB, rtcB; tRNA-splicing ligase RtcB
MSRKPPPYDDFCKRRESYLVDIKKGFVPGMNVPAKYYMSPEMNELMVEEYRKYERSSVSRGGFLPSVVQLSNVAALPGIVKEAVGLPDMHAGYGFPIGSVAGINAALPSTKHEKAGIVSPGGVGFDINCGVRLLRTNLMEKDVKEVQEKLVQAFFDHVPVGVGSQGIIPTTEKSLNDAMELGMDWQLREGYAWPEDKEHCEEYGRMLQADPSKVSIRAKKRGQPQLGTLGAGNHYAEIQAVDRIYDRHAARRMGVFSEGQVMVMIHSGSRGFGHQVATDALVAMENHMKQENITTNDDKQLQCGHIHSKVGQNYLAGMACAANYAWANRGSVTFLARQAFAKVFNQQPDDLDMHLIYDVSHNIAKFEEHMVNGKLMSLLVHRKGATRAFPPFHPLVPIDYQHIGQPILIGGSMGTGSHVLLGTDKAMSDTFGSTCHGAGRAQSRNKARNDTEYQEVLRDLQMQGISVRMASPKLVMEECSDAYKDVDQVVNTCHAAGISKKCIRLRPLACIKG